MKTVKLGDRIVALDQIAMVESLREYSEILKDEKTYAWVTLKIRTPLRVAIVRASSDLTSRGMLNGEVMAFPPGTSVTSMEGGNEHFSITQPEYEKLVWALEAYNA